MDNNVFNVSKSISLRQVYDKYSGLEPQRAGYSGNYVCPLGIHSDSTPSFHIYPDTNTFYCFGCKSTGSPIDFVMKLTGLADALEAAKLLCKDFGLSYSEVKKDEGYEDYVSVYQYVAGIFLTQACEKYLEGLEAGTPTYYESRGIHGLSVEYQLGYCPAVITDSEGRVVPFKQLLREKFPKIPEAELDKYGLYDKYGNCMFSDRYVFTLYDDRGNPVGFSGRAKDGVVPKYYNTGTNKYFKKNTMLYNYHKAKGYGRIYIVEGYTDVLSLVSQGVVNCVATMGTALTKEHLEKLKGKEVVLAYDNDDPGRQAMAKHIENNPSMKFKVLDLKQRFVPFLAQTAKDINEAVLAGVNMKDVLKDSNLVIAPIYILAYLKTKYDLSSVTQRAELYDRVCTVTKGYNPVIKDYVGISIQRLIKGKRAKTQTNSVPSPQQVEETQN